jgi:2-(1,2-epoxy-1,2-dihydrophenyl)acetyl-CoA isomerase
MDLKTVIYEKRGGVSVITLDRPDALNALSLELTRDIALAIKMAVDDGSRVVILTGNGRAFCSGGDLREMRSMWESEGRIEAFLEEPLATLHDLIRSIRDTPIPFIAAVNGVCAGAGTNLALACDMVFAADDASFNEAFIRIGLTPDCGGSFFLPRAVGEKLAAELFMTGENISAERAAQIGMINRVVPASDLMAEALKLAERLARAPTAGIGRIKKLLNSSFSTSFVDQLKLEHKLQIESGRADDFREGVTAFFEKREPQFTGR